MTSTLYGLQDVAWYKPEAVAVSRTGLIAMTCGNTLIFARVSHSQPVDINGSGDHTHSNNLLNRRLEFIKKVNLNTDKCNAICFSPIELQKVDRLALLFGKDVIKVIDYPSLETVYSETMNGEIRTIRFMEDRPMSLVIGFVSSEIAIVELPTKQIQRSGKLAYKMQNEELQDMDICKGLLVLGCHKGSVAIVDTRTWKVLRTSKLFHRIRAVKWRSDGSIAAVSSSLEKTVLLIGPDEHFTVPLPSNSFRSAFADKEILSSCVGWNEDQLIIGTPWGCLCHGKYLGKDTKLEVIQQEVTMKSLCAMVSLKDGLVLTTGIERVISLYDVNAKKLLRTYASFAGFIYDMKFHPAGTGALAAVSGCGRILLAKTDQGTLEHIANHLNLRCRVYCCDWHPENEMQLAIGTQGGEVFIVDVAPQKTTCNKLVSPEKTGIGTVCYASIPLISEFPVLLATDCTHVFFSKPQSTDLVNFSTLIPDLSKHKVWCVTFLKDRSLLFLGTRQGKIITVDAKTLVIVSETLVERGAVHRMVLSPNGQYIGAVYGSNYFNIFKVENLVTSGSEYPINPCLKINNRSCYSLCWNPFNEDQFAIGSIDGNVELFSLHCGNVQETFKEAAGTKTILVMQWSPINPNKVYLGSNGNTLYELDLSKKVPDNASCGVDVDLTERVKDDKAPSTSSKSKGARHRSNFPYSSNLENTSKSIGYEELLLLQSCQQKGDYTPLKGKAHLGFFSKDLVKSTLNGEFQKHQSKMDMDLAFQVLLLGGDLKSTIDRARASKQLSYQLVTLSNFVSNEFFLETVDAFIEQNRDSDLQSVVSLMVIRGRAEEAVKLLSAKNHHKDAITIVLQNFDSNSEVLKDAYIAWAERYMHCAQYERAARCFLAAGQPIRAIEILSLYTDPLAAMTAAILAKRCSVNSKMLLNKAILELLQSPQDATHLERLGVEFQLDVLKNLKHLSIMVKAFNDEAKPEDSENGVFNASAKTLDQFLIECKEPLNFHEDDATLLSDLLEHSKSALSLSHLLGQITLEIAICLAKHQKREIDSETKTRISKRVSDFEKGKCMYLVLAMLQNDEQQQPLNDLSKE